MIAEWLDAPIAAALCRDRHDGAVKESLEGHFILHQAS
jgi:hypothetical protein